MYIFFKDFFSLNWNVCKKICWDCRNIQKSQPDSEMLTSYTQERVGLRFNSKASGAWVRYPHWTVKPAYKNGGFGVPHIQKHKFFGREQWLVCKNQWSDPVLVKDRQTSPSPLPQRVISIFWSKMTCNVLKRMKNQFSDFFYFFTFLISFTVSKGFYRPSMEEPDSDDNQWGLGFYPKASVAWGRGPLT